MTIEDIINQKLFLCGKMNVHYKDNRELLLFPDYPKWVIVGSGGGEFLKKINGLTLSHFRINASQEENEFVDTMIEDGILIFNNDSQIVNIETSKGIPFPLQGVWLNISSECNLRCKHCFLGAQKRNTNELSVKEIDALISELIPFRGNNPITLDLTGGEPLLRNDIYDIINVSKREGISTRIITNGLLLTPQIVKVIVQNDIPLIISLDGVSSQSHEYLRGKDTFQTTINSIKMAVEEGADITLSMTVHDKNVNEIFDFLQLAQSLNVSSVNYSFLNPIGSAKKNQLDSVDERELVLIMLRKAIEDSNARSMLKKVSILGKLIETVLLPIRTDCCGTGVNTCAIDSNGDIYPCPSYQIKEYKAGNIRERSFKEIWTDKQTFNVFREIDISTLNSECANCEVRFFCGGGCRAKAHLGNDGTLTSRSKKCDQYKPLFLELIWLLSEYDELTEFRTEAGLRYHA